MIHHPERDETPDHPSGDDPADYDDTDLPEGVSVEDALRRFMQVDPDAVQQIQDEDDAGEGNDG